MIDLLSKIGSSYPNAFILILHGTVLKSIRVCLIIIIAILKELDLKPLCLGKTLTGNPLHPAPMVVNRFFGGVNNVVLEIY